MCKIIQTEINLSDTSTSFLVSHTSGNPRMTYSAFYRIILIVECEEGKQLVEINVKQLLDIKNMTEKRKEKIINQFEQNKEKILNLDIELEIRNKTFSNTRQWQKDSKVTSEKMEYLGVSDTSLKNIGELLRIKL